MSHACRCGRPKGRPSDLSCLRCWERLPVALRDRHIRTPSRTTERKIVAALAEIDKAVPA